MNKARAEHAHAHKTNVFTLETTTFFSFTRAREYALASTLSPRRRAGICLSPPSPVHAPDSRFDSCDWRVVCGV